MYKPWVRTQVASGTPADRISSLLLNYNSEAFMYRDLYSAIMCRPLLSAERQGENEEEKVRPDQRPLLTRAE
ncbi:hypothetical protein BME01_15135 [Klebsiella pneumoniae]|nr:hypothetical protein BME03_14765 [Klebsiella pneumoniae]OVT89928.1 hypothetical protein BME01_15135 [Klebsiella pneumoniae]PNO84515.1 hypothetical protein MC75_010730 [Klebsiella pneumoniae]HBX2700721.1 hypothetical protein [Klebsiella pneumoniae]